MKRNTSILSGLLLALATLAVPAHAQVTLFADNFESGNLDRWTGKLGGPHHGQIVVDPLDPSNHVVNFFAVDGGGDMFSASPAPVDGTRQQIKLSFDFLALPIGGVVPPEYGGFVGISGDNSGPDTLFVAGTYPPALNVPPSVATALATDGQWHHYEIDVTDLVLAFGLNELLVSLEDWYNLGSIPGDVYFDNVKLTAKLDPAIITALVPCAGPVTGGTWKNHGDYVSTMDNVTGMLVQLNLITLEEQDAYVTAAAESTCGKK